MWLIELLAKDEFVVVVAVTVLRVTITMVTNKIFVNSIPEDTKEKEILISYTLGGIFEHEKWTYFEYMVRVGKYTLWSPIFHLLLHNLVLVFHSYLFPFHP